MKRAVHAVAWLLLVTAALVLWPQRWGGSMTYVLTEGSSMAPAFTAGDLAVLRTADEYGVGDVLAYESPELDRVVLHRVVREQDGGLVLRGDANDFDDPEVVPAERVLGRLVLQVPGVGRLVDWATQPLVLGVGVLALLLLTSDRRPAPARAPRAVAVNALDLPPGAVVVHVEAAELSRLAGEHGLPVLEVADGRRCLVVSGAVYEQVVAAVPAPRAAVPQLARGARLPSGAGLSAGVRPPAPRRSPEQAAPAHAAD